MEIKISAADMLSILVDHGLEQSEAKAIIYDLIVGKPAPRTAMAVRRPIQQTRPATMIETTEEVVEAEAEEEPEAPRRHRRVNFKGFGGPAEGLGG